MDGPTPNLPPPPTAERHLAFWDQRLRSDERSYVYVIQGRIGTPIKVGIAADPIKRLATLQTGNPERLMLLFVIPGGVEMERALHQRLHEHRTQGEWFEAPPEFLWWMRDYCEAGIERLWTHAELPLVPEGPPSEEQPKPPRGGLVCHGFRRNEMGHRWRTSDGQEHPIVVHIEKP